MTIGAFIPIKATSERVPGKNFREFRGRPLYEWIIDHAIEAGCFDAIHVDTDSPQIAAFARCRQVQVLARRPELATAQANGNHLLVHHAERCWGFDLYFQLFATAPLLRPATIRRCVEKLRISVDQLPGVADSILTVVPAGGWHWMGRQPLYRPEVLPRSQDAVALYRETTGLYGITRAALLERRCRVGAWPIFEEVDAREAVDLDHEWDFLAAEAAATSLEGVDGDHR